MGYWISGSGWEGFIRKYLSIIVAMAALSVLVGALSGYAVYVSSGVPSNATNSLAFCQGDLNACNNSFARCAESRAAAENMLEECNNGLNRFYASFKDTQVKLSACNLESSKLSENLSSCENQLADMKEKFTSCESDISTRMSQVDELKADIAALQAKYDAIVANSARGICCTLKIYDPSLKYYYIDNDKIKCTAEANESLGTKEFSCF